MSIQLFDELAGKEEPFPDDKNVRILIAGLAFCKFDSPVSTIEFLRHVPHHQLTMTISQKKRDGANYKEIISIKISEKQNVKILGALENKTNNKIGDVVGMKTLHECRIERRKAEDLPAKLPTFLKLENCNFYTYKKTDDEYSFYDTVAKPKPAERYCEILGGYMAFSNDLTISIGNGVPLVFPINEDFPYEISFNNSCDNMSNCGEEEDFKYVYDIVKESVNPHRRFQMIHQIRHEDKTIRTGACLPVCENC